MDSEREYFDVQLVEDNKVYIAKLTAEEIQEVSEGKISD